MSFIYTSRHKPTYFLHDKADRRSLLFLSFILMMIWLPTLINIPPLIAFLILPLNSFLSFTACIINHNHLHAPIFRHKNLNRALNYALTLAKGHSALSVKEAHNFNHHKYHGTQKDWASVELAGQGWGVFRLITYIFKASLSMKNGRKNTPKESLPPALRKNLWQERFILFLAIGIGLFLSPLIFFLTALLPWLLGMAMLVAINLIQHDDCDITSKMQHSRDFTSKTGNWLLFNNGYHRIHHLKPNLRWSQLPLANKEMSAHFGASKYQEKSLCRFILTHYILSSK